MEFSEIVMRRYAAKRFDGRSVPGEKLDELMDIIRYSASSYNLQPYKIKLVSDQKTKEMLQKASWDQPQVGSSSHVLVFCADTDTDSLISRLEANLVKAGASKESLQDYVEMMRSFSKSMPPEAKLAWSQKQAYIALGNAINGAAALGFDSCPMEGFDPKKYSEILGLPENLVPSAICPIGYAADKPRPKVRRPKEELFI